MTVDGTNEASALEEPSIFSRLPDEVVARLAEDGITSPTPVQQQSFGPILDGRDILGQSMTGSGKTLAFALPIAVRLAANAASDRSRPRVLILTPTRELAQQVTSVFQKSLAPLRLRTMVIIGGASYYRQQAQLEKGVDIVVGTPGRVVDLIKRSSLDMSGMETFVLDEVDQMLDFGFADDLTEIRKAFTSKMQTVFFSATLSPVIVNLAREMLQDPVEVKIKDRKVPEKIDHGYVFVKSGFKLQALINSLLYHDPGQAIIFCETKKECGEVSASLIRRGINAAQLNSDLGQAERQTTMNRFRHQEIRYLVATNVAARGIDIQELPLVINYSVPRDIESYTHRTGRTGRAGASGKAWTIVTPRDVRTYTWLMRQTMVIPEHIELHNTDEIYRVVAERQIQSLMAPRDSDANQEVIRGVLDKILEAIPDEAAKPVLAGFLANRLNNLDIYDSSLIRCQTPLVFRNDGRPMPDYPGGPGHQRYRQRNQRTDIRRTNRNDRNK